MNNFLGLIYMLSTAKYIVLCEFRFRDMEIVRELSTQVTKAHHCECNIVIIPPNATTQEVYNLEKLTKQMAQRKSEAMPTSVMLYNPEEFSKINTNAAKRGSCFKWLAVVMASDTLESYLSKFSDKFSFTRAIWLLFANGSLAETGESLKTVKIPINSQVWIVDVETGHMSELERKITLHEVFRVAEFQPLIHEYIGQWSKKDGLSFISNKLLMRRRHNFQGHALRVGAVEYWPMVSFMHGDAGKKNEIDGYLSSFLFDLGSILNFTTDIRSVDNSVAAGSKQQSGEWTGIIGMASRGEVDVLLTVVDYSPDRMDVLEYLLPILKSHFQVLYKPDSNEGSSDLLAMFRPFHSSTWLAIVGIIAITSAVFYIVKRESTKNSLPECDDLRDQTAAEIFFFVLSSFCVQGCSKVPKLWAARVIFIVTYLTATILLPLYSASLISKLTRRMPSPHPFDEIKDIWNTDYKLLIAENTSYYSFFNNHEDPQISKILQSKTESLFAGTVGYKLALRKMCIEKNLAILVADGLEMSYIMRTYAACPLRTIKKEVATVHSSIGMTKHSPYASASNFYMLRMMETGILCRMKNSYSIVVEKPPRKEESEFSVSMSDVAEAFIILLVSNIVSLIILGIEVALWKVQRNYEK